MAKEEMQAAVAALGITMETAFVPFSRSRNKDHKMPSLNWRVTIKRNGRDVLTTDYMQGYGHCPAYKADVKTMGGRDSLMRDGAIRYECEHGHQADAHDNANSGKGYPLRRSWKLPAPDVCDVLYSLASDADAIDCATFEEWASNYGYDTDSRKAEGIYRACLEIALKLRAGLGEDGLQAIRDACQDY